MSGWRVWLEHLSPPPPGGHTVEWLKSMTEALQLAAPAGPAGVESLADVELHRVAIELHYALSKRRARMPPTPTALPALKAALRADHARLNGCGLTVHHDLIAETETLVSSRNAEIAHARRLLPNTWAVVEAWSAAGP